MIEKPSKVHEITRSRRETRNDINYEESDDEDFALIKKVPSKRKKHADDKDDFEPENITPIQGKKAKIDSLDKNKIVPKIYLHNQTITEATVFDQEGKWDLELFTPSSKPIDYFNQLLHGPEIPQLVHATNARLYGLSNPVGFTKKDLFKYIGTFCLLRIVVFIGYISCSPR